MRARSLVPFAALSFAAALLPALAPARADDPKADAPKEGEATKADGPVNSVQLAKSWDQAVKDAKAQNVPIVLHSHGFYCPPCWGMHASLMCDKAYIEFAYENTVEVLCLDRLKEGVDKNEARAATYDAKAGGKPVKYLVEFPGLTVDDVLALRNSNAASYNKSGGLPYTALIDPFTEEEVKSWKGGGIANSEIIDAVKAARATLAKAHGKGKPRPELKALGDAEAASAAKVKAGDFAGALDAFATATKKADKDGWPTHLQRPHREGPRGGHRGGDRGARQDRGRQGDRPGEGEEGPRDAHVAPARDGPRGPREGPARHVLTRATRTPSHAVPRRAVPSCGRPPTRGAGRTRGGGRVPGVGARGPAAGGGQASVNTRRSTRATTNNIVACATAAPTSPGTERMKTARPYSGR